MSYSIGEDRINRLTQEQIVAEVKERNTLLDLLVDVLDDFPKDQKSNAVEAAREYLAEIGAT